MIKQTILSTIILISLGIIPLPPIPPGEIDFDPNLAPNAMGVYGPKDGIYSGKTVSGTFDVYEINNELVTVDSNTVTLSLKSTENTPDGIKYIFNWSVFLMPGDEGIKYNNVYIHDSFGNTTIRQIVLDQEKNSPPIVTGCRIN